LEKKGSMRSRKVIRTTSPPAYLYLQPWTSPIWMIMPN
jgi:hypothetical protein